MFKNGVLFTCLAIFILGCSGTSSNSAKASNDTGTVKFKIDGIDWVSAPPGHPARNYEEEAITVGKTMVRIEAFSSNGSYLALTIFSAEGISPGTYPIIEPGMSGIYKDDFNKGESYLTSGMIDNSGVVTITGLTDKQVSGNFNFSIRNSVDPEDIRKITDGSFDLPFTTY